MCVSSPQSGVESKSRASHASVQQCKAVVDALLTYNEHPVEGEPTVRLPQSQFHNGDDVSGTDTTPRVVLNTTIISIRLSGTAVSDGQHERIAGEGVVPALQTPATPRLDGAQDLDRNRRAGWKSWGESERASSTRHEKKKRHVWREGGGGGKTFST